MSEPFYDPEFEDPRWTCGLNSRLRGRLKDGFDLLSADQDDESRYGEGNYSIAWGPSVLAYAKERPKARPPAPGGGRIK